MFKLPTISFLKTARVALGLGAAWLGGTAAFGDIENTAVATGSYQGGITTSEAVTAAVPTATSRPEIMLRKGVREIVDVNKNGITDKGDTIVYRFEVHNTGNVTLSDIRISDKMVAVDGDPITSLAPGRIDVDTFNATYEITQDDVDNGGVENTATVSALPPITGDDTPVRVSDISDSTDGKEDTETGSLKNEGDDDPTNDPTVSRIAPSLGIVLTKGGVLEDGGDGYAHAGDLIRYTYEVENTSSVTVYDVSINELLSFTGTGSAPVPTYMNGGGDYDSQSDAIDLRPGEKATFSAPYGLTQTDVDTLKVSNQAEVTATTLAGDSVSDLSDSVNAADDSGSGDDMTVVSYEAAPELSVVKTTGMPVAVFPSIYDVTYQIVITNSGNTTQTAVVATDDLATILAPAQLYGSANASGLDPIISASGMVSGGANTGYDGSNDINLLASDTKIAPNTSVTIDIKVRVSTGPNNARNSISNFPAQQNTVSVSSDQITTPITATAPAGLTDADGDGTDDNSESTGDRDGDGLNDIQDYDPLGYFYCEADGRILSGGRIAIYDNAGTLLNDSVGIRNGINILFDGSTGLYQWLSVGRTGTFRMELTYPNGTTASTTTTSSGTLDVANAQDVYTGAIGGAPGSNVSVGAGEFLSTGVMSNYAGGTPLRYNRFWTSFNITAFAPNIIGNNIPVANCSAAAPVTAEKTANKDTVTIGERVAYTLTYSTAALGNATNGASFVDQLPKGISYVPNSATLNGVAQEPTQSGGRLTWSNQTLTAGSVTTIRYTGVVGPNAPFGKLVNRTWIANSSGQAISNVAKATVERTPEAVFDCTDVIGKVFDDKNYNGYQDQGEPGIAGARVVTVRGTRITADKFGRFHIPCAELPSDIGTNFILKLDERSLPSGYRLTTENPRVVRLTAGKFAKMNFGVALSNVVRVGLTSDAFTSRGEPSKALQAGIAQLVEQMREKPSVLNLTYYRTTETKAEGRARSKKVEALIRKQWRRRGSYKLNIERVMKDAR